MYHLIHPRVYSSLPFFACNLTLAVVSGFPLSAQVSLLSSSINRNDFHYPSQHQEETLC